MCKLYQYILQFWTKKDTYTYIYLYISKMLLLHQTTPQNNINNNIIALVLQDIVCVHIYRHTDRFYSEVYIPIGSSENTTTSVRSSIIRSGDAIQKTGYRRHGNLQRLRHKSTAAAPVVA